MFSHLTHNLGDSIPVTVTASFIKLLDIIQSLPGLPNHQQVDTRGLGNKTHSHIYNRDVTMRFDGRINQAGKKTKLRERTLA
jgi:hypothetical protein